MRLYLDENVHRDQADALRSAGHNVYEVTKDKDARGKKISDEEHAIRAQKQNRVLITEDKDFGELRNRRGLPETGVVYAKPSAVSSPEYPKLIVPVLKEHQAALEKGAFITVSADKVRVSELEKGRAQPTIDKVSPTPQNPERLQFKRDTPREQEKGPSQEKPKAPEKAREPEKLVFKRDTDKDHSRGR